MKIAVIGSGHIGGNLGRLWSKAGHKVLFGSRDPQRIKDFASELGARAVSPDEAASWADVIALATPWRNPEALPYAAIVEDKIVIDAMNPYGPDGALIDLGDSTSSEETQKRLPNARLVKAFNAIPAQRLATAGNVALPLEDRYAIPIAGNDTAAKTVVADLIAQIGFGAVDMGDLHEGGKAQGPGSTLYGASLTVAQVLATKTSS